MIRAEPSLTGNDEDIWIGKFKIGEYWRTVRRDPDGKPHPFATEAEALHAARNAWWTRTRELGKRST